MKTTTILLIAILLASCSTTTKTERAENRRQAKCTKYGCNQGVSDSIMIVRETKIITRDTTIYDTIQGETKINDVPVVVDNKGLINSEKSTLTTSLAISTAWVENGILHHELIQKDSILAVKLIDAIRITQINESKKHVKQPPPVRINYITGWQKIMVIGGYILIGIIVIAIVLSIQKVRNYLKLI